MSGKRGRARVGPEEGLYYEIQCITCNGCMGPTSVDRLTD